MPKSDAPRLCRVAGRNTWHIYHERRRISTGCEDRAEAEVVLARYLEGEARPSGITTAIGPILKLYLEDRASKRIPGLERLQWAHKQLNRYYADKPVEIVTPDQCDSYLSARQAEGVGASTVRTELQAMRAALAWAKEKKIIEVLPEIKLPPRPPARERWLTREEADRLIKNCRSPHIRLFVILALHTGARKSAVLGLKWDKVNLEHRLIDFVAGHAVTRKRRARVPINDTLLVELLKARELAETEYVIEYAGGQVGSIKHGFTDACIRAGLKNVMPSTLRHTAATWMAQKGVSLWDIAGFLGHTNMEMVIDTYGHWHPDFLQKAAKALG